MPFKPNYTDIRSTKMRDPLIIRTVGASVSNTSSAWVYLNSGTTTRPSDFFLVDGVILTNPGPNTVVVSDQGLSSGTWGTGTTFDGFQLVTNQVFNLKVNNLADVIFKSTQSAATGVTLSYIAS